VWRFPLGGKVWCDGMLSAVRSGGRRRASQTLRRA
jgi:hypothetical protein